MKKDLYPNLGLRDIIKILQTKEIRIFSISQNCI